MTADRRHRREPFEGRDGAALRLPAAASSSSRTGPVYPAGATSPPSDWASRAVAAGPLRQEPQAAPRRHGRPARRPLLRRPRARPGRARHHVDAGAAADDQHDGADRTTTARRPRPFYADPIRRYMLPVFSDRRTDWPSHPHATRDSLHEHDMWVAEGLTHRYPTKVLAELLPTCPQYCGHCTRMDLVGNSTPQIDKLKLTLKPVDRLRRDARLPARPPRRPRRRRLRRRRRQHAVDAARGLRRRGCSTSTTSATSGWPPRP